MGKYTLRAGGDFDARVDQDLGLIVQHLKELPESREFLGVVLMGGYGRGEGTPLIRGDQQLPFNDYDLIVVGKGMSDWRRRRLQQRLHGVEAELSHKVNLPVDLCLYSMNHLYTAEPSLLNTELKHGHRVLWGSDSLLQLMPDYGFDHIPLIEGTRLLMNRGVLMLYLQERYGNLVNLRDEERLEVIKYIHKNYLAFGDCVLMALGRYQLSYEEKRQLIMDVGPDLGCPGLDWIRARYLEAIEFKQWGDPSAYDHRDLDGLWEDCRAMWVRFFLWFESKRLQMAVSDLSGYVRALESRRDSGQPVWKVLALNSWLFRWKAVKPNASWLTIHPRFRVFAALWAFMARKSHHPLVPQLLGSGGTAGELQQRLFQLRSRLS